MMKKMKKLAALAMALTLTASLLSTAALAAEMEENEYEPSLLIEAQEPSVLIETMEEEIITEEMDEEIIIEDEPAEKPCSVEFVYAAADAVDGAVAAPEGVTAPEKIEDEQSFRLSKADLSYGTGEIPEGYTFSGWYIQDSGNWYKLEDMLRFLIIYSHTEVYGYWTYSAPEQPEQPEQPAEKPCSVEFIYAAADAVDGAVAAPEGVTAPGKIENEQSFRLSEADLAHGTGEIPEGYTFSGWYIEDSNGWYKVEDVLGFLIIYSHTEVYGYWTYTEPENPGNGGEPEDKPEIPDNGGNNNNNNGNQTPDNGGSTEPPKTEIPEIEPPKTEIPETTVPDVTIDEEETPLAPAPETVVEEVIEDEQAPLAAAPEVTESPAPELVIVDEVVPMGNLPQTGTNVSNTSAIVFAVLALASGLAAAGFALVLVSKKGKEN